METAGVEPTPPRCKRGVLPPERPLDRCGRMESNHQSLRLRGYNPVSSPVLSVRVRGSRPDSNRHFGNHDPGCLPLHHGHHGSSRFPGASLRARMRVEQCCAARTARRRVRSGARPDAKRPGRPGKRDGSDRTRTGTLSPDKRALCSLSYAPKLRRWDSNPRSRAHEAREDGRSSTALRHRLRYRHQDGRALPVRPSELTGRPNPDVHLTALGLAGRSRTCDLRCPKPAGWPSSPTARRKNPRRDSNPQLPD